MWPIVEIDISKTENRPHPSDTGCVDKNDIFQVHEIMCNARYQVIVGARNWLSRLIGSHFSKRPAPKC